MRCFIVCVTYFSTGRNNSKTFSGIFCSNRGNQPIALLDFTHLLPLKVKGNFYVLELLPLIRSKSCCGGLMLVSTCCVT
jgi:hypothetical protein